MNSNQPTHRYLPTSRLALASLAAATCLCIAMSIYYPASGTFIVFQNLIFIAGIITFLSLLHTKSEGKLKEQLAQLNELKDIINRSGSLVFIWRVEPGKWPVEFVSDNAENILGYSVDDFISGRVEWPAITHPNDVPRLEKEVAQYLEKGERKWSQEYRLITKSGEVKWFRDDNLALEDSSGKIIRIQAVIHDVTKRKLAEEKASMLSDAIETAHHGCLIVAESYKLVFGNNYALTKLGFDSDELKNFDLFSLCADREQVKDIIETTKVTRRWMGEIVVIKKDGGQFPALVSVTALGADDDASGRGGDVVLFQDITIQKEMREKLLASEKLAVMGRLVADVAHELNNPLAIIIGGTQLVLSRLETPQEVKFKNQLETILRNAMRCKTILANLLGYGRAVGRKEEAVNLPDLIREAIDDVNYQHDMSAIETVLNCNEMTDAEIAGNRSTLLSVFINLIRNARQAMGEKGRLTITIEKEDEKHLRVEIHDTGVGISREQRVKLFKPFTSGWKKGDGSGLGLATSLGIIEIHGGSMSAESEGVGKGATFTILLPCEFGKKTN